MKKLLLIALMTVPLLASPGHLERATIAGRPLAIYTPAGYDASRQAAYDLVVFFDGDSYIEELEAVKVLDALPHPPIALFVDNTADRLGDLANHRKFADYMAGEVIPAVRARWNVTRDPAHTTLAGYSAGGLGAAYVAFRHPEVFGNVISESGAFWRGNEGTSEPAEWLTEQFKTSARLPLKFYLDVGGGETHRVFNGVVFIEANRRLRDALKAKGYSVEYVEVPGAHHEPGHWKHSLPAAIAYYCR
jgi:enterochelin esterase-like enzyme